MHQIARVPLSEFLWLFLGISSSMGYWTFLLKVLKDERREAAGPSISSGSDPVQRKIRQRKTTASLGKIFDPISLADLPEAHKESRIRTKQLYDFVSKHLDPGNSHVFCQCGRHVHMVQREVRWKCGTLILVYFFWRIFFHLHEYRYCYSV